MSPAIVAKMTQCTTTQCADSEDNDVVHEGGYDIANDDDGDVADDQRNIGARYALARTQKCELKTLIFVKMAM